jgi:hypothetical protein
MGVNMDSVSVKCRGDKLSICRTKEKNFFVSYKNFNLDIGDETLEGGLIKALMWFGHISFNEGIEEAGHGHKELF